MLPPKLRWRAVILSIAAIGLCGAVAGALAAGSGNRPVAYEAAGGNFTGVRPTAGGLPQIGESGTVGAGEFAASLRSYHDSGAYGRDLTAVGGAAKAYLDARLAKRSSAACSFKFKRARGGLYRRVKSCPKHKGKPAIVLDIDETSLSNYAGLAASGFTAAGLVAPAVGGTGTAIAPTLALYKDARSHRVAVFFITGRPTAIQSQTESNLHAVGYDGWTGISFKPGGGTEAFKSSERAKIERQGYDIVVNMGDQESDLDGGHADRAFKLPNPFYFVAD
jgi:HAD superfamily, subfamily IIIB (Acid phosphatase)